VIGGMWRWGWTAGVFGVFFVVVGAALKGAPPPDGALPVIEADGPPIKERVALPDIGEVVPRSSVLNLLADGDEAAGVEAETLAALEAEIEADAAREREVARIESALETVTPGETAARPEAGARAPEEAADPRPDVPFTAVPEPDRRPARVPEAEPSTPAPSAAEEETPSTATRATAARSAASSFRIQLAAVPPGEEHATFERLEARFGDVLTGLAPRFQAISTDRGVLVRIQATGFASEAAAAADCRRIREAGGECFVVAGSG
jgi:hypothetical protein